jgi:hypothetical protein
MIKKLVLYSCLIFTSSANAHLLKVFAHTQNSDNTNEIIVSGKVYFSGGAGLNNLTFKVIDETGQQVLSPTTDKEGKFNFNIAKNNYQIIANSHDGHIAKWQITGKVKTATLSQIPNNTAVTNNIDTLALQTMIDKTVATQLQQQLAPLNQRIHALQEKRYFQDIIGALGYILGLFGVALWYKQRAKPTE